MNQNENIEQGERGDPGKRENERRLGKLSVNVFNGLKIRTYEVTHSTFL